MALTATLPQQRLALSRSAPRRTPRPAARVATPLRAAPPAARAPALITLPGAVAASRAAEPRRCSVVAHATAVAGEPEGKAGVPSEAAFGLTLFFWFTFNAVRRGKGRGPP